jgi:hypothetical protein
MRLGTLGAACALCAAAVPASAAGQSADAPAAPAPSDPPVTPPPPALAPAAAPLPGDMQQAAVRQLVDRHIGLSHRYERLVGDRLTLAERREIRNTVGTLPPPQVRAETRELRADIRQLRRRLERKYGGAPDVAIPPVLKSIAQCESHGDPRAISSGGTYRGKYQFSYTTWATVGGEGDPAAASETEQDRRAAILYRRGGPGHWPVCGR